MEGRILGAGHIAGSVDVQFHGDWLGVPVSAMMLRQKGDGLLLAMPPDGIELLEPQTDRIHHAVAAQARWVQHVILEALAVGLRARGRYRRQVTVGAGRRIWDFVTEELLPDKVSA